MIVTLATPEHLPGLLALEGFFEPGPTWSEATWLAEFDRDDRHLLVALDSPDGDVVGAAAFRLAGDVVDLDRVAVAPDWRRRGLASAMVMTGLEWTRQRKARRMLLEVHHTNRPAIALYEAYGFTTVARRDNYYGRDRHANVMELVLADKEGDADV